MATVYRQCNSLDLCSLSHLSLSQTGAGAAAAQSAETHVAESQRPVPGVSASPNEGHAEDRECAVVRTAPPGGGDEEERPGTSSPITAPHLSVFGEKRV